MAPLVESPPAMNVLQAWPLFTAFDTTGFPLIGGKLYSYAANTSVPKATYADPYGLAENSNPVLLNSMGQAVVWLDGFYHLRLEDADGVQLWDVLSYEYPAVTEPPAPGTVSGYTDVTVNAVAGVGVLQVPNAAPLGYRITGAIGKIVAEFGASNGLQQIACGDSVLMDGWFVIGLTAGLETGQQHMRRGDEPVATTAYTILLSSLGGLFDSNGSIIIRTFWRSITGWT